MQPFAARFCSVPGAKWRAGGEPEHLLGPEHLAPAHDAAGLQLVDRHAIRNGWCGAASHGSSRNQPMKLCGSLTRTRTSTRPDSAFRFSRSPS